MITSSLTTKGVYGLNQGSGGGDAGDATNRRMKSSKNIHISN